MKRLKQLLSGKSLKEWLENHPGSSFHLWMKGYVTVSFSFGIYGQCAYKFHRGDSEKPLNYINMLDSRTGVANGPMTGLLDFDEIEEAFSKAEEVSCDERGQADPYKVFAYLYKLRRY